MTDPGGAIVAEPSIDNEPLRGGRRWPRRLVVAGAVVFVLWVSGIALLVDLVLAIGEEETGPGDWASPAWYYLLAMLATASLGALLIDRTGRLGAAAFGGTALVAWVGPEVIGGSAAPWDAGDPPLGVVVPALGFAVAALWAGRSAEPDGRSARRWSFWVGVALSLVGLGVACDLAVGLVEPDEYRLTVRAFACPAGSGPVLYDPAACVPTDGGAIGWRIEGDVLAQPLEIADAEVDGTEAIWDDLPNGLYRLTLTAATLPPSIVTVVVPDGALLDQPNAHSVLLGNDGRFEPDGAVFRAFRSLTVEAYLFPGVLDSSRRGTVALTAFRCPAGMTAATLEPAACTPDPAAIEDALLMAWPSDELQIDLADAALEGDVYVWRDVPAGPYALIVVRFGEDGERFVLAGGSGTDAGGGPAPEGGSLFDPFLLPEPVEPNTEESVAIYVLFGMAEP